MDLWCFLCWRDTLLLLISKTSCWSSMLKIFTWFNNETLDTTLLLHFLIFWQMQTRHAFTSPSFSGYLEPINIPGGKRAVALVGLLAVSAQISGYRRSLMDIILSMAAVPHKSPLDIVWQQAAIHIHKSSCWGWRWIMMPLFVFISWEWNENPGGCKEHSRSALMDVGNGGSCRSSERISVHLVKNMH